MPINLVYEDPVALGQATRDAYGLAQRRRNLEQSIDNQLKADQANAHLAYNYEQLYGGLAEHELDRNARLYESAAEREYRLRQQTLAQEHEAQKQAEAARRADQLAAAARQNELADAEAARRHDLAKIGAQGDQQRQLENIRIGARRDDEKAKIQARRDQAIDRLHGTREKLLQAIAAGAFRADDPFVHHHLDRIDQELRALATLDGPVKPPPRQLTQVVPDTDVAPRPPTQVVRDADFADPPPRQPTHVFPDSYYMAPPQRAAPPNLVHVRKSDLESEAKKHPPGAVLIDEDGAQYRIYRKPPEQAAPASTGTDDELQAAIAQFGTDVSKWPAEVRSKFGE